MLIMAANPHCSPRTEVLLLHLGCASSLLVCQEWVKCRGSRLLLIGVFEILTNSNDDVVLQSERGLFKHHDVTIIGLSPAPLAVIGALKKPDGKSDYIMSPLWNLSRFC